MEKDQTRWRRLKASIRDWDEFGVPVQLNFNKDATHKSCIGGLCSIFALIIMTVFIVVTLCQLIFVRNFSQGLQTDHMDPQNPDVYTLTPTDFTFAFNIEDRGNFFEGSKEEMLKYIDFYFYTIEKKNGGVETNKMVEATLCTDLYSGESQDFLA